MDMETGHAVYDGYNIMVWRVNQAEVLERWQLKQKAALRHWADSWAWTLKAGGAAVAGAESSLFPSRPPLLLNENQELG
eukprot:scaffold272716_cov23-Tisochrysis_lutea.AAC.1